MVLCYVTGIYLFDTNGNQRLNFDIRCQRQFTDESQFFTIFTNVGGGVITSFR